MGARRRNEEVISEIILMIAMTTILGTKSFLRGGEM